MLRAVISIGANRLRVLVAHWRITRLLVGNLLRETDREVTEFGALFGAPTALRLPAFGEFYNRHGPILEFNPLTGHGVPNSPRLV